MCDRRALAWTWYFRLMPHFYTYKSQSVAACLSLIDVSRLFSFALPLFLLLCKIHYKVYPLKLAYKYLNWSRCFSYFLAKSINKNKYYSSESYMAISI